MAKAAKSDKKTDQNYVDSLEAKEKGRYLSKIEQIGGKDRLLKLILMEKYPATVSNLSFKK